MPFWVFPPIRKSYAPARSAMWSSTAPWIVRHGLRPKLPERDQARVVRAILKATDICASKPEWVARQLTDKRYVDRYDYAIQTLADLPYNVWREYDPEDTVRFYALRMRELGMIKSSPQKIIADNTDWRFLDELKRELKA